MAAPTEAVAKPVAEKEEGHGRLEQNYSKKRVGEGDVKLDNERLAKAIDEEKKRKMRGEEDGDRYTKKKKGVSESGSHDVTEEELGTCPGSYFLVVTHRFFRGLPNDSSANGGPHGQLY